MSSSALVMERAEVTPPARLAPLVAHYSGYRYEGLPPGTHRGLPSPYLTVVLSLGAPTRATQPGRHSDAAGFPALAGGMHTRPVLIEHDGDQYGVQLSLTPQGARSLLGMPAGELASVVIPLDGLLRTRAAELTERLAEARSWPARFAVLDEVLSGDAGRPGAPPDELRHAWRLIVGSGGLARVADIASEVGWSRRHLAARFTAEYGLTPKETARVVRFQRSKRLLSRRDRPSLAEVAAVCGFYDQAHLAREWNDLCGCPPSAWLTGDDLPFIQDGGEDAGGR
ncbi:helix-turn-helix domain-containing protein [Actinoallomurus sp. CA-142502]|uniref:helix-turn-helix domain-containing protein n=1 Tax=Actinoallomurus sp. CA-142502 TaxID=3239885 RepID=UPI003D92B02A